MYTIWVSHVHHVCFTCVSCGYHMYILYHISFVYHAQHVGITFTPYGYHMYSMWLNTLSRSKHCNLCKPLQTMLLLSNMGSVTLQMCCLHCVHIPILLCAALGYANNTCLCMNKCPTIYTAFSECEYRNPVLT